MAASASDAAASAALPAPSGYSLHARALSAFMGIPLLELLQLQQAQRAQAQSRLPEQRGGGCGEAEADLDVTSLPLSGLRLYSCGPQDDSSEGDDCRITAVDVTLSFT